MADKLKDYFPSIRNRQEILDEIQNDTHLTSVYYQWNARQRERFLEICSGARGVKILYDSFFREIFNPDTKPGRLEELLSLILGQTVKILHVLPNESNRITAENPLLIMDVVIQLENGSIANLECQKVGYLFPGQRAACYSADLLMRQYRRVRRDRGEYFKYSDIRKVYTIIFYEKSPQDFHAFPGHYIHHSTQKTDTGLKIELLQEFYFLPLDIFLKYHQNKGIKNMLEAWLTFLGSDRPEDIMALIWKYPRFRELYEDIYTLCLNTERVMEMFSEELLEMDKNTARYMMDEMQEKIDTLEGENATLQNENATLQGKNATLQGENTTLQDKNASLQSENISLQEQKMFLQNEIDNLKKLLAERSIQAGKS